MSGFSAFWLVAGREIREAARRRSFIVVVTLLFLASLAAVIVPELIGGDDVPSFDVGLVSSPDGLAQALEGVGEQLGIDIATTEVRSGQDARGLVEEGELDAVAELGRDGGASVTIGSGSSDRLQAALQQALGRTGLRQRLVEAGLDPASAERALGVPPVEVIEVGEDPEAERGISAIAAVILYIAYLTMIVQVANGIAIEKSSRISEVLLAIVRPPTLLFGKVVGVATIALAGVVAIAVPILGRAVVGGDLPARALPTMAATAAWFVVGAAIYATLAGALGALVERQEEAGTAVQPVTIALIATFFLAQAAPDSGASAVLVYVPFVAPILEPARIAVGAASGFEIVASALIAVATLLVVVRFGAVVYRRAIVHTGSRLKLSETLSVGGR